MLNVFYDISFSFYPLPDLPPKGKELQPSLSPLGEIRKGVFQKIICNINHSA